MANIIKIIAKPSPFGDGDNMIETIDELETERIMAEGGVLWVCERCQAAGVFDKDSVYALAARDYISMLHGDPGDSKGKTFGAKRAVILINKEDSVHCPVCSGNIGRA